jgi:hypothetical protein
VKSVLAAVLAVVVVLALGACGASPPPPARGLTGAQRLRAVENSLTGTRGDQIEHDGKVLRAAITASGPALRIEETCVGGGMLNMTVDFPGHAPAPFSGTCDSPATGAVIAGVVFDPTHPSYGTVTVAVHPSKRQDYWIGIGAQQSS